jgi:hypothetical protein
VAQALFYGMALYGAYLERRGDARPATGGATAGEISPRRPGLMRRQMERRVTRQQEAR